MLLAACFLLRAIDNLCSDKVDDDMVRNIQFIVSYTTCCICQMIFLAERTSDIFFFLCAFVFLSACVLFFFL